MTDTQNIVITQEKLKEVMLNNMESILKDVLTGWNSPVKKVFEDKEFVEQLQTLAKKTLSDIITDKDFQEQLKNKLLEKAVQNMISR